MQVRYAKGSVFAFSKRDLASKREYVVVINNSAKAQKVAFNTASSSGWNALLGKPGISSKNGSITINIAGLDAVVLQAKKDIGKLAIKVGKISAREDFLSGYHRLTAAVQTNDLAITEFFVKGSGSSNWQSLGVDLNAPFRVYLDPKEHSGKLQVKAIVTTSQGRKYELPSSALNIATP